jgi:hypothetical protein
MSKTKSKKSIGYEKRPAKVLVLVATGVATVVLLSFVGLGGSAAAQHCIGCGDDGSTYLGPELGTYEEGSDSVGLSWTPKEADGSS